MNFFLSCNSQGKFGQPTFRIVILDVQQTISERNGSVPEKVSKITCDALTISFPPLLIPKNCILMQIFGLVLSKNLFYGDDSLVRVVFATRVKTHKLLQVCKQVVTSLFTSCQQVVFALLVPSLL